MKRLFAFAALALVLSVLPASAAGLTGKYIEARTCDVWTGPCFANAEMNLAGKHAVLGWKVDQGEFHGVRLDGLGVVAVVAASDTLGLTQTGKGKAVLIIDSRATTQQREALTALAEQPHPDQAVAWGGSGIYRLRWPGIRILYQVDEDAATVYLINVAVTV